MKKKIIIICTILVFFIFLLFKEDKESIPEEEKLVWAIALQTAQEFNKDYGLQLVGVGQSGDKKDKKLLKTLMLSFTLDKLLSKKEGRKIILNCADELIDNINNFIDIQPFLAECPFTEKNVELSIYFSKDRNHSIAIDPDICCISLWDNNIYYFTNEPLPPHAYKNKEKETLEDARRMSEEEM